MVYVQTVINVCFDHESSAAITGNTQRNGECIFQAKALFISSWGCNTAAARHHERTCIDMDVIVVQAALPHIFDRQVIRKALILDIGVCIMEGK